MLVRRGRNARNKSGHFITIGAAAVAFVSQATPISTPLWSALTQALCVCVCVCGEPALSSKSLRVERPKGGQVWRPEGSAVLAAPASWATLVGLPRVVESARKADIPLVIGSYF